MKTIPCASPRLASGWRWSLGAAMRRRQGPQRGRADALPDPQAGADGLVASAGPVRQVRQGAVAARLQGLQGSLLGLPFAEAGGVPHAGRSSAILEAQVKALAAEYTVQDGPNDAGDMFDRPGIPSD